MCWWCCVWCCWVLVCCLWFCNFWVRCGDVDVCCVWWVLDVLVCGWELWWGCVWCCWICWRWGLWEDWCCVWLWWSGDGRVDVVGCWFVDVRRVIVLDVVKWMVWDCSVGVMMKVIYINFVWVWWGVWGVWCFWGRGCFFVFRIRRFRFVASRIRWRWCFWWLLFCVWLWLIF